MTDVVDIVVEEEPDESVTEHFHKCTDADWVDYVLDHLSDRELSQGNPTTDGLRRVAEKIFGRIVVSDTEILEVPTKPLTGKATAKHRLVFERYDGGGHLEVSACVDVLGEKLPSPYNQHLIATACTRAEGKALRRALKIRIQTAEEMFTKPDVEEEIDRPINDQQIVAINQLCKRCNLNAKALVDSVSAASCLQEVSNIEGRNIINKCSEYQRNPKKVDTKFLGYKESWQEDFNRR